MSHLALLWAVPLVALLGYVSHRASLCTVRAVADALNLRRFEWFGAFARAALWAMTLTVPATYFWPERFPPPPPGPSLLAAVAGGLLFGFGASLNKGCSFSTLQRLADADWRMLITLGGFIGGSALCYRLPLAASERGASPLVSAPVPWLAPVMVILTAWAAMEVYRLWHHRHGWRAQLRAPAYGPGITAALLGLGAGALYLGFGPWTYTNSFQGTIGALAGVRPPPPSVQLALVPALFAGMLYSAWRRGAWTTSRYNGRWGGHLAGGTLMGLGSTLIPGGNDTLLLRLIPSLTPHGLWSYLALIAGVACGLLLSRHFGREAPRCPDC